MSLEQEKIKSPKSLLMCPFHVSERRNVFELRSRPLNHRPRLGLFRQVEESQVSLMITRDASTSETQEGRGQNRPEEI